MFEKWRNRPIPPIAHLFLDATDTKVRRNDLVSDGAVFVAVCIEAETGRRMVPGVSVGFSEAAEHRAAFIQSLIMRGMNRPNCITSDDHKGIRKTLAETLTGVPWQRCPFHFQQNAQAHVTSMRYRSIAAAPIRNVFNAGNRASANLMIQNALSIFRAAKQYKLADWVEENIEECLTVIDCPPEVQRRLRTSNIMESMNR
ncbi:MAG: transposase [Akkermansia sp.]